MTTATLAERTEAVEAATVEYNEQTKVLDEQYNECTNEVRMQEYALRDKRNAIQKAYDGLSQELRRQYSEAVGQEIW